MISSSQVNVGSVSTLLHDCIKWARITIHNVDNTKSLYLGGAAVTTANGLPLLKQETIQLHMSPGESLYGISSDGGGHTIGVLVQAP